MNNLEQRERLEAESWGRAQAMISACEIARKLASDGKDAKAVYAELLVSRDNYVEAWGRRSEVSDRGLSAAEILTALGKET